MAQARSLRDLPSSRSSDAAARIGEGTRVRGRVSGEGDLSVEGSVEGPITLRGDLEILEGGSAVAEAVEANNVTVSGSLEGDVAASGQVRLLAGARVRGNLRGASITIEDGARFAGRIDIDFDLPAELERGTPARR